MAQENGSIALASLNVCFGWSHTLPPVRERAAQFCRLLQHSDLDVVNFQEVWSPALRRFLHRRLPSHPFAAYATATLGHTAGGLVSFSRTPPRAVRYTSLRGTRPQAGGPLFRAVRAAAAGMHGVLTFELPEHRTVVGNVHLTANHDGDWSPGNRHEALQAAQVRRFQHALRAAQAAAADPRLVIAAGDFNLPSTGALYKALLDDGRWRDPFAAADLPTFHPELLPAGARPHRIDYLLVHADPDRHPVTETRLLFTRPAATASAPAAFLSDHLAQLARIALPAPGHH
jgi:endonuclease/exonuclease/phosphatase family metal-dependent hydrolase